MVKKKGKSKRVTLKDKYKIQKRVVESHRKARKQAKRDNKSNKRVHNKPKDPGIPNSWPFKRELLDDIARSRELVEANKKLARDRKQQQQQQQQQLPSNNNNNASNTATSEQRLADEKRRAANGDKIPTDKVSSTGRPSLLDHLRELRKVIRASDVLLQVLDARDPIGTRIPTVLENHILSSHSSSETKKRMILILNKADLVPKNALSQWLTHLRKYHPTLAIKSVPNRSSKKASKNDGQGGSTSSPPHKGVGVKELLQLLKNHAHRDGSDDDNNNNRKSCITVGIIGYPNVGKSSILNSLKRCCVATGDDTSRPGHTNTTRTIQDFVVLDKNVRFLHSPGLVVCHDDHVVEEEVLTSPPTMSGRTVDSMKDPILAVRAIVTRCNAQSLMMWYSIPAFDENDVHTFLTMISKRNGTERKGGIPDNNDNEQSAARMFLKDWNTGKIRYYTPPPSSSLLDSVADTRDDSSVVFGCSNEESTIVSVMDSRVLAGLPNDEIDFVKMKPTDNNYSSPKFTTNFI